MRFLRRFSIVFSLWLVPVTAAAGNTITVPGLKISFMELTGNIVKFLAGSAALFCTALFLIGAFYMALFAYDETKLKTGKDLMIGSLIGLAVIIGSYAILRTIIYVIYCVGVNAGVPLMCA